MCSSPETGLGLDQNRMDDDDGDKHMSLENLNLDELKTLVSIW